MAPIRPVALFDGDIFPEVRRVLSKIEMISIDDSNEQNSCQAVPFGGGNLSMIAMNLLRSRRVHSFFWNFDNLRKELSVTSGNAIVDIVTARAEFKFAIRYGRPNIENRLGSTETCDTRKIRQCETEKLRREVSKGKPNEPRRSREKHVLEFLSFGRAGKIRHYVFANNVRNFLRKSLSLDSKI